jgi:hypothetical protein
MSNPLEKFVRDNRDQFDSDEPSPQVWKKLEKQLIPQKEEKKQGKVITRVRVIRILRLSVAAAIVILAGFGVYSLIKSDKKIDTAQIDQPNKPAAGSNEDILNKINPAYAKEVYHFTQLIELKQSEIKQLEKDNPQLYKQFLGDINKLDSSYKALKKELPVNPNREQLLEAMIQNLRLQTELLNQQLEIIHQIKNSKSNSDESNSKSI